MSDDAIHETNESEIAGVRDDLDVTATAGEPTPPPEGETQPDNSDPDQATSAETHVNEGIAAETSDEDGEPTTDTLWATEEDRIKRTEAASDTGPTTAGVTYPLGTDPSTVNVLGGTAEANPDVVVPKRGEPIAATENRSVPYELTDHHLGGNAIDFVAQPQTPDPLANQPGGAIPAAYAETLPPGASRQPGAPAVDYPEGFLDDNETAADESDKPALAEHLTVGTGDESSSISWSADHRGISGLRTLGARGYLASEPNAANGPERPAVAPREAIPQTALGGDAT